MKKITEPRTESAHACVPMPDSERLNFYYGQPLGVADFQTEQNYFLEKLRLYNRCFHGYGIVCGLEVKPVPTEEDCLSEIQRKRRKIEKAIRCINDRIAKLKAAADQYKEEKKIDQIDKEVKNLEEEKESLQRDLDNLPYCLPKVEKVPAKVCVNCGLAVDCEGREIIMRQPQKVDLWSLFSQEQIQQVEKKLREVKDDQVGEKDKTISVELSVCYCEQPTYPSRPVIKDTCVAVSKCVYGRTREGFKFRVSLEPSEPDERCSNCCEACESECVVLAYIHWNPREEITWNDIDWGPRRSISLYQASVITGVSWLHGASYSPDQAKDVLGTTKSSDSRTDGIEVTFSKPVYAETLQPGVVDLWRIHGGHGLSGMISHIEGSYMGKPAKGLISSFKYRDDSGETLNDGDRVLIIIRGNFILDACCQPVDAEHVGGLVPQLKGYPRDNINEDCLPPVSPPCAQARHQPWTSGNGRPGAIFESWFFIKQIEMREKGT